MKKLFKLLNISLLICLCESCMACSVVVQSSDFVIRNGRQVKVFMPVTEREISRTALGMLEDDMMKVVSARLKFVGKKEADVVLGIDNGLPREGFTMRVAHGRLYINGADDHGLAFGILELSRKLGVSPWEYWADCVPKKIHEFRLEEGYHDQQYPKVAYRGIFINDEDWGLNPWATKQEPEAWTIKNNGIKGAIGPRVNEKIFQLLLRLRANYYWPAMHECSQPFFTIPGNREMARKYGIYISGSHCEPMATSPAAEWQFRGNGDYNYVTNREHVQKFWKERLEEVRDQEIVYTLGMRGVHDGPMQGVKTLEEKTKYLQMVLDDQRRMLGEGVPQVFIPYKEVLDIYKNGLYVPDDVTLMWTDDNYGYIRHFPDSVEKARGGGNGLYYHCSYWGRPHDYLWLNSMPLSIMENQLGMAYGQGIRQIWVLNVGDLKPSELQTEYFLEYAWKGQAPMEFVNTGQMFADSPTYRQKPFLERFCEREFGEEYATSIAHILERYLEETHLCKPEFMAGTRVEESDKAYWNVVRRMPGDWDKASVAARVNDYQEISDSAEVIYNKLPDGLKDAFFQLVKYPVQAAAQMSFKYLCSDRCEQAHDSIQALTKMYNKTVAGGKWDGIMDASPRRLAVFQKVTPDMLPEYPDHTEWEIISDMDASALDSECNYRFDTPEGTDSVTIQVRLLPTHPVEGKHLTFAIRVDNGEWKERNYETNDRSEEWKQNVLRGYAERTLSVPVDSSRTHHAISFKALSKGVFDWRRFHRIYIKK